MKQSGHHCCALFMHEATWNRAGNLTRVTSNEKQTLSSLLIENYLWVVFEGVRPKIGMSWPTVALGISWTSPISCRPRTIQWSCMESVFPHNVTYYSFSNQRKQCEATQSLKIILWATNTVAMWYQYWASAYNLTMSRYSVCNTPILDMSCQNPTSTRNDRVGRCNYLATIAGKYQPPRKAKPGPREARRKCLICERLDPSIKHFEYM